MDKKEKKQFRKRGKDPLEEILRIAPSPTDPSGSYTGKPMNPDEVPVQDSDDL